MRQVSHEYRQSPEGIAATTIASQGIKSEDFAIDIPSIQELPPGYDSAEDW